MGRVLGCLIPFLIASVAASAQERPGQRAVEIVRRIAAGTRRCDIVHYDIRLRMPALPVPAPDEGVTAEVVARLHVEGFLAEPVTSLQLILTNVARITAVRVGDVPVRAFARPISADFPVDLVEVPLPAPLARGDRAAVTVEYSLPSTYLGPDGTRARRPNDPWFGADEAFTSLGSMWYPGLFHERYTIDLALTLPAGFQAVASGEPEGEEPEPDGRTTWRFAEREGMSVITFYAARWARHTRRRGEGELALYVRPEEGPVDADRILDDLAWCLDHFEKRFGPSGLKRFAIAMTGPSYEAASYNALHYVALWRGYFAFHGRAGDEGGAWWFFALAHETAHVWWGHRAQSELLGHGGNWLREGLAEYSAQEAVESRYGARLSPLFCARETLRGYRRSVAALGPAPEPSLVDITYATPQDTNYDKGAWLFLMLEKMIGPEAFARALARYLEVAKGKLAVWKDFYQAAAAETDLDLRPFFTQWLIGTDHLDLAVRVEPGRIVIAQSGDFPQDAAPAFRVTAIDATGAEREWRALLPGNGGTLELPVEGRPVRVSVDPDAILLDWDRRNNSWPPLWDPGLGTVFLPPGRVTRALESVFDGCALYVHRVEPGSPAERERLGGRIITAIDGRPVRDPEALEVRAWSLRYGEPLVLTVRDEQGTSRVVLEPVAAVRQ